MFCALISLQFVKSSVYNMANNSNNSSDNSESETELPDLSTLKPFEMEPRKNVNSKNYKHSSNVNPRTF